MRAIRSLPVVLFASSALLIASCAGAASTAQPSASTVPSVSGGPVTTEADALARVLAIEPRFTGIGPRDPDLIGQSSWFEVAPASGVGAFLVTMRIGWGDCPAGCIDEHTWLYAVGPDGSVTLQSESGTPIPPEAWPSSGGTEGVTQGLHITAVAGPTCPVETVPPDPACAPKPVPNVTIDIVDDAGHQQARIVLDSAGKASVALEPGAYTLNAQGVAGLMNGPEAQRVVVEDRQVAEVTLTYDTGIR
jgi:hypothetical protein